MNATDFLKKSLETLEAKAKMRDQPNGERNMLKTVNLFNTLTGRSLSESDGWMFMILLKITRMQTGSFNEDDYVDLSCYSSLLGECEYNADAGRGEENNGKSVPSVGYVQEMGTYSEPDLCSTNTPTTGRLA